jgi:hypothetical protein
MVRVLEVPSTMEVGDALIATVGAIDPPVNRPVHPVRSDAKKTMGMRRKREWQRSRQ